MKLSKILRKYDLRELTEREAVELINDKKLDSYHNGFNNGYNKALIDASSTIKSMKIMTFTVQLNFIEYLLKNKV